MAQLEAQHVHNVYSQIASHFSDTRYKPWPRVAQFLQQQLPPGSLVADVGTTLQRVFFIGKMASQMIAFPSNYRMW